MCKLLKFSYFAFSYKFYFPTPKMYFNKRFLLIFMLKYNLSDIMFFLKNQLFTLREIYETSLLSILMLDSFYIKNVLIYYRRKILG